MWIVWVVLQFPGVKVIETGEMEHAILHKPLVKGIEGESYWDCYMVPLKSDSGNIDRLIQITRNVTEKLEAQAGLEKRINELRAINGIMLRLTKEDDLNGIGQCAGHIPKIFRIHPALSKLLQRIPEFAHLFLPGRRVEPSQDFDFFFETPRRRDLDGGLKITQDAICDALGVNDNRVVDVHLVKRIDPLRPRIEVELEAILDWKFDAEYVYLGDNNGSGS